MKKRTDDIRLIVKSCVMYFEEGMTQAEISKVLNLSRPTVSRMLKEARDLGIVHIDINYDFNTDYPALEKEARKELGLKEVIIVKDSAEDIHQKILLAKAAAKYLERSISDGDHVGVSMGTTLREIAQYIESGHSKKVTFIPIIGGVGQTGIDIHPNQLVRDLAVAFNGDYEYLHGPAVLSSEVIKENLLQDDGVKKLMQSIKRISHALVGIGSLHVVSSTMIEMGYFDAEILENLKNGEAIGDICLQFYDIDGKHEKFDDLNRCVFGIGIDDLKQVENVIAVAGGIEKAHGILGAINGGYINTLITNYACCKEMLLLRRGTHV